MKLRFVLLTTAAATSAILSACASSSITQLSRNSAVVSTSAAPICKTTGAANVAQQMAAITTIKQGFLRFVIVGYGTADNTRLVTTGPTNATTTGTFNRFGNTVYADSTTSFGGQRTFIAGHNEAQIQIVMLNPGDDGFDNGIDAKQTLGPEWENKVADGVPTCL